MAMVNPPYNSKISETLRFAQVLYERWILVRNKYRYAEVTSIIYPCTKKAALSKLKAGWGNKAAQYPLAGLNGVVNMHIPTSRAQGLRV